MEIAPSIQQTRVSELLRPECAVPITEPGGFVPQPRPTASRRRKYIRKTIPWVSLRQVKSTSTTNTAFSEGTAHSQTQTNGGLTTDASISTRTGESHPAHRVEEGDPHQRVINSSLQSSRTRADTKPSLVRSSMLKLLFWRHVVQQNQNDLDPVTHEIHGVVPSLADAHDSGTVQIISPQFQLHPAIVSPPARDSEQDAPGSILTIVDTDTSANAAPIDLDESAVAVAALPEPPVVTHVQNDDPLPPIVQETDSILEFITSTNLYSPEENIYVGKLDLRPPPPRLDIEWRQFTRPLLVRNLRTVLAALPPSLSRAETMVEPELCMSGNLAPGQPTVALRPTVWIRCGSAVCRAAVAHALADLSILQDYPVHITRHAPRPAATGPRLIRSGADTILLPEDTTDEIRRIDAPPASVPSTTETWQEVAGSLLHLVVQRLRRTDSACGLVVRVLTEDGSVYLCTLGGMIVFDDEVYGLTTAHTIWDSVVATADFTASSAIPKRAVYGPKFSTLRLEDISTSGEANWIPATLRAASYIAGTQHEGKSGEPDSIGGGLEGINRDFMLLKLSLEPGRSVKNEYMTENGANVVTKVSSSLRGRAVQVLCSPHQVRGAQLLDGESTILDHTGCWETRKIRFTDNISLQPGASGTWVVDEQGLVGIITAVYDDEPFAHIIPISTIFNGIAAVCGGTWEQRSIKVLDRIWKIPVPSIATSDQEPPPKEEEVESQVHRATEGHWEPLSRKDAFVLVVPLVVMLTAISLDVGTFPVLLPTITNTYYSLHLAGWYGSAYFSAFGLTYPAFVSLHSYMDSKMGNRSRPFILLISTTAIFVAGNACSIFIQNAYGMIYGRALSGAGAAGSIAGLTFTLWSFDLWARHYMMLFLSHAIMRFVGPIIAGAMMSQIHMANPWKVVLGLQSSLAILAIFTSLAVSGYHSSFVRPPQRRAGSARISSISLLVDFMTLTGAVLCVQFALYYGPSWSWRNPATIALGIIGGTGCSLLWLALQWYYLRRAPFYDFSIQHIAAPALAFLWGSSYYSFCHILPFWLGAVRGYPIFKLGTMFLPLAATYCFGIVFLGWRIIGWVRATSYSALFFRGFKPTVNTFMIASLSCMALAAGLLTRSDGKTPEGTILGLQALFGVGASLGAFQLAFKLRYLLPSTIYATEWPEATQTPRVNAVVVAEVLGGAIGIAATQAVLVTRLMEVTPETHIDIYEDSVLHGGATNFREQLSGDVLNKVVEVFNEALTSSFYVSVAAGALPVGIMLAGTIMFFVSPLGVGILYWKSRKKKRQERRLVMANPPALAIAPTLRV